MSRLRQILDAIQILPDAREDGRPDVINERLAELDIDAKYERLTYRSVKSQGSTVWVENNDSYEFRFRSYANIIRSPYALWRVTIE